MGLPGHFSKVRFLSEVLFPHIPRSIARESSAVDEMYIYLCILRVLWRREFRCPKSKSFLATPYFPFSEGPLLRF